ncbi:hypothetical protein BJ973_002791 [Actinoplanes tereljensis]|uniref:N-acetyltransferase domain-containing protein n=1 Tax=Paractinoplanes tereljensis TaxID=571912 RepID=A0A919NRW5_9ACTN|nr:hypothetical protein [Actinoplanes tereljensis]GIF22467.1 hypothetical protein Ate02nite_51970 [Actinoplanes tereljensis]
MRLDLVTDRAGLREFQALPMRLHPADRYVPMANAVLAGWWRGKAEFYLVRDRKGEVVGRTCLHRDPRLDAKLGRDLQLFGLTEFVDDDAVAAALFQLMAERGRDLFGPVGLLPNQTGGVITSGFDERGFIDSTWNPAYYPATYERHGFTRRFESDTWRCDLPDADPDALFRFDDERLAAENLVLRHGSRRRFGEQLPILREMLNASFARLGYYTEIDADELAAQTDGLAYLLDESLLMWLEKDGRPVAFVVTVPDVSRFLMARRGDLGLVNQLRLLATRGRYRDEAVLIIKGTVPGEQGRGYLTLLSRELFRNLVAGGYRTLRSTFVERDNPASAAQYPRMGGRPLHGYTFYQRPPEYQRQADELGR